MFCTLFVTGGVAFWLLLLAASVLFFACEENDDSPSGTILAIIAFLGCWFLLGDLKTVVAESPWAAAFCPLLWVGLGMLWSFPRWILFLKRALADFIATKADYMSQAASPPHDFASWVRSSDFYLLKEAYGICYDGNRLVPPPFAYNRKRLVAWVLLWPWSLVWTFCREIVLKGVQHLVGLFGGTYARMSAWIFGDVS